ncbi:MAG: hypothetical protein ACI8QC_001460 [Planctomycetota bacterium]|jgi:hypothetical protein
MQPLAFALLFLGTGSATAESAWEYLAERYDADGDGKISRAEYTRTDEHFARLDRDENGVIEAADMEIRSRMRGRPEAGPEAPAEGEMAPDFELDVLGKKSEKGAKKDKPAKRVRLSASKGKKPVALIFGSYT